MLQNSGTKPTTTVHPVHKVSDFIWDSKTSFKVCYLTRSSKEARGIHVDSYLTVGGGGPAVVSQTVQKAAEKIESLLVWVVLGGNMHYIINNYRSNDVMY